MAVKITAELRESINAYMNYDVIGESDVDRFIEQGGKNNGCVYFRCDDSTIVVWDAKGTAVEKSVALFGYVNIGDIEESLSRGGYNSHYRTISTTNYSLENPNKMAVVIAALFGEAEANKTFTEAEKTEIAHLRSELGLVFGSESTETSWASTP